MFVGKIDLITTNGEVIDHKTGNGASSDFFRDKNVFQASGYIYAFWRMFGKMPRYFIFNNLIKGNSKREPEIIEEKIEINLEHLCIFFEKCKYVLDKITAEETRDCVNINSCRFCPFKDICEYKKI